MQAIIDFFSSMGATIMSLIDYAIGFIEDLISLMVMLGNTVVVLPKLLFVLVPTPAVAIGGTVLAVAVLYKVLGREG